MVGRLLLVLPQKKQVKQSACPIASRGVGGKAREVTIVGPEKDL